jgi:hypothetical protein
VLHDETWIVPRQIMCCLQRYIMQHEWADNAVHSANTELVQVLCAYKQRDDNDQNNHSLLLMPKHSKPLYNIPEVNSLLSYYV